MLRHMRSITKRRWTDMPHTLADLLKQVNLPDPLLALARQVIKKDQRRIDTWSLFPSWDILRSTPSLYLNSAQCRQWTHKCLHALHRSEEQFDGKLKSDEKLSLVMQALYRHLCAEFSEPLLAITESPCRSQCMECLETVSSHLALRVHMGRMHGQHKQSSTPFSRATDSIGGLQSVNGAPGNSVNGLL